MGGGNHVSGWEDNSCAATELESRATLRDSLNASANGRHVTLKHSTIVMLLMISWRLRVRIRGT